MIHLLKPHHPKIVTMGMSCVGKTTFANLLRAEGYAYHSFDHHFRYNLVGLPGYSAAGNWVQILASCTEPRWVLDNWNTEDRLGAVLQAHAPEAAIYLLYDHHRGILDRYRVPVTGPDALYGMYAKMYKRMDFEGYGPEVRFFRARGGSYQEAGVADFRFFIAQEGGPDRSRSFDPDTWRWTSIASSP